MTLSKTSVGHIDPFWEIDTIKSFPYTRQPISDSEIDMWISQGYDHIKNFSGLMYGSKNLMPDWVTMFEDRFTDFKNITYNFYKMDTLNIMPTHSDHFRTYINLFNAIPSNIYRILVMLEDWKPGHYLELDSVGVVNWKAGDYFMWNNDTPHAASNIGIESRYTLQITAEVI